MFAEVANYANDAGMYIFIVSFVLHFSALARGNASPSEALVYEVFSSSSVPWGK